MLLRKSLHALPFALVLAFGPTAADAAPKPESFPQRPVRVIVPYAPGGATDITARMLATRLNEAWGNVGVVVDNRAGASGNIGIEVAARANADGYTLLVGNVSTNAINETTFAKTVSVRASRDLTGVTNLIELPHVYAINPSVPAGNLKELVEHVKRTGAKLNYGSAGVGTYPHLDAARFLKAAGIDLTHVPYKSGGAGMITGILGNEVQMIMVNLASSIPHIRGGRIKALATTWPNRRPELPDVPTMAESGFPGFEVTSWYALLVPAGTAQPIVARLGEEAGRALQRPDVQQVMASQGLESETSTPQALAARMRAERKVWADVIRAAGIRAE
jgi:tripartite-type tricarboxylate transporter receptor subunit TctC